MKSITWILLGFGLLTWTAPCRAESNTNNAHSCCCAATPPASTNALTDQSLYQIDATWTNDSGRAMKLSSLRGQPQIVLMFFASCPYACPLLVHQVKQIEAALPETLRNRVGFTLVTFDSERDTPQVLKAYREQHDLAASRWTLLHGDADAVLDLAALLGVRFKKDANGQFSHSNVITLLNADGEIAFQQAGLNSDAQEMVRHIEKLINTP